MSNEKKPPVSNVGYYHSHKYHSMEPLHHYSSEIFEHKSSGKMNGTKRVILFCLLTAVLPTILLIIPLYLRRTLYKDMIYALTESDVLEIKDGISPIFCSEHSLKMNETFNAFQVSRKPETTSHRKHIRLQKSMTLPDDTLEYWGFYLLKGATVALSVCSRFQGASILVVKGERNLRTCGMLDHNKNKAPTSVFMPHANEQVKVTLDTHAQEINSKEHETNNESTKSNASKHNIRDTANIKNTSVKSLYDLNSATTTKLYEESFSRLINNGKNHSMANSTRQLRHVRKKLNRINRRQRHMDGVREKNITFSADDFEKKKRIEKLQAELNMVPEDAAQEEGEDKREPRRRMRREGGDPINFYDQGIKHGGNNAAKNGTNIEEDSSVSSFENGLLTCYRGQVLLSKEFDPSDQCMNVSYLINTNHMQTMHQVSEDGYYYYIFYSDNDDVTNDIHAVFDIYKPTLLYENVTKACVNQTECSFTLNMMSSDRVIVEVPTRDGIDHEIDDIALLKSVCHPRMGIYVVFPIAVMIFILGCAFV